MPDFRILASIDSVADAAYIALSGELGMVVGIETLRLDADIPVALLVDRFHVKAEVAGLLLAVERSAGSLHLSQGHDGYAAKAPVLA